MDYQAYLAVIRRVDEAVRALEGHPDEAIRGCAAVLLSGIDALHREGLERLVARLRDFSGDALVERLTEDRVVATLLGLYGLAELEVPDEAGEVVGFVPLQEVGVGPRPGRGGRAAPTGRGAGGTGPPAGDGPG